MERLICRAVKGYREQRPSRAAAIRDCMERSMMGSIVVPGLLTRVKTTQLRGGLRRCDTSQEIQAEAKPGFKSRGRKVVIGRELEFCIGAPMCTIEIVQAITKSTYVLKSRG